MNRTIPVDDDETEVKPPVWAFIRKRAATRSSPVNSYQAQFFAKATLSLERALLQKLRAESPERLPANKETEIFGLDEYQHWTDAAFVCGFVCDNGKSTGDLEAVNSAPSEIIRQWSFPELRQYVHYLQRSEKWGDGYSSPVFRAIRSGALRLVAQRLEADSSLYEDGIC